jgi:hypothetical protein
MYIYIYIYIYREREREIDIYRYIKIYIDIYGWIGPIHLTKTVRKPERRGVNFDPPMIFCACSMPNAPAASEMPQDDFVQNQKFYPQNVFWGGRLAVVAPPPYTKPSQKPKN